MNTNLIEEKKINLLNSPFYKELLEQLSSKEQEKIKGLKYEDLIEVIQKLINLKSIQKADYFD